MVRDERADRCMNGGDHGEMDGYVVPNNAPIDVPALTSSVGSAIIDQGVSGLGPGTAPVTPSATSLPTNVPQPEIDATHITATEPYVDYTYVIGPDGKLYGPHDPLPAGPSRRLQLRIRRANDRWHVTAAVDTPFGQQIEATSTAPNEAIFGGSRAATDAAQAEADRIIVDKTASAEAKSEAGDTWSRLEQTKEDRLNQFTAPDARTAVRQTLAQLQKSGLLYALSGAAMDRDERRKQIALRGAAAVLLAVGAGALAGALTAPDAHTLGATQKPSIAAVATKPPPAVAPTGPPQGTHTGTVALTRTDPATTLGCKGTVATLTEPIVIVVRGTNVVVHFTVSGFVPAIGSANGAGTFSASGGGQTWSGGLADPVWRYLLSEAPGAHCTYTARVTLSPPFANTNIAPPQPNTITNQLDLGTTGSTSGSGSGSSFPILPATTGGVLLLLGLGFITYSFRRDDAPTTAQPVVPDCTAQQEALNQARRTFNNLFGLQEEARKELEGNPFAIRPDREGPMDSTYEEQIRAAAQDVAEATARLAECQGGGPGPDDEPRAEIG